MEEDIVFAQSVLEVRIKILRRGLSYIYQKHPELDNQSAVIQECLKNANEIWTSKQNKSVFLYYKRVNQKYICVVCKHYNGEGFLITAYFTYKLQGDKKVWTK